MTIRMRCHHEARRQGLSGREPLALRMIQAAHWHRQRVASESGRRERHSSIRSWHGLSWIVCHCRCQAPKQSGTVGCGGDKMEAKGTSQKELLRRASLLRKVSMTHHPFLQRNLVTQRQVALPASPPSARQKSCPPPLHINVQVEESREMNSRNNSIEKS